MDSWTGNLKKLKKRENGLINNARGAEEDYVYVMGLVRMNSSTPQAGGRMVLCG